ncbi:major capsid protein [Anaerocolumna xylanovorans]|uniref:Phage major capsid protein E n=1 Tax=Anaerocolumna xylanovorans DSM 12503 TaxID=1121345 RepID=A0A1M7YBX1_9FIRM|nr:major capsid protein [Anaerocolumna xylanovorans]SHO50076.1 Phage major capsid protein E [Anaerocolumna xylanovorans DSM 12503]
MPDYTTREMMEAIDQTPPVRSFLQRTFFPGEETHVSEKVEFDVRKGKRVMAPLVSPRKGGKVITRQGFKTNQFTTPKIAPERPLTIDDISQRAIGENIYSQRTPEEREDELLAKDETDLEEAIDRRKEWMCRQILFEGKIDVQDEEEGVDVQIDFGFDNITVLGSDELWSLATVNPLIVLRQVRKKIIKNTGSAPDIAIFSSDAIEDFITNPFIEKAMNMLNMKNVVIEPRVVDPALTFYGRIAELDLDIYTYDEWFLNDDGEDEAMIPSGTVLLGHSKGEGQIEYGSVTQMEDKKFVTYEGKLVPKQYADEKNETKMLRLTSRPLPRPFDVESWAVLYVNGTQA